MSLDLTNALAPKSDQLDFADLEGRGPQIFTVTEVRENGSELADQQPVNISLAEFPRVWRPSKGMLRVLAAEDNWGKDTSLWVGRRVELYGDPNVYFGKEKRGGTRIKRLSHIPGPTKTLINPRGGRNAYWSVQPLPDAPTPSLTDRITQAVTAFGNGGVTLDQLQHRIGAPTDQWTEDDLASLNALFTALKNRETTKEQAFGGEGE